MPELTTPIVVETPPNAQPLGLEPVHSVSDKTNEKVVQEEIYHFHAYHLAEALKLKEVAKVFDLKPLVFNPTRLVYELSPNCYCFFYNFGSVVFFNVDEAVQKSTLERIKIASQTNDAFLMEVIKKAKNTVTFDKVIVDKLNREKIELVGLVLAQSTALEFFEKRVEEILEKTPKIRSSEKNIREFIGQAMTTKQNLIRTLYLLEKPEETWDNKILDDLHQEATLMFELKDRFRTIDYKLKTIQDDLMILANFTTNRQHLILEWAVVALIVLEVLLFGYELFLK